MDPLSARGLQRILVRLGHDLGRSGRNHDGIDGRTGPKTRSWLERFQERNPEIPRLELGRPYGAVTTWFLTLAARSL